MKKLNHRLFVKWQKPGQIICTGFLSICLAFTTTALNGQSPITTTAKAQINAWTTFNFDDDVRAQLGGRVIPVLNFEKALKKELKLDAEASFNSTGYLLYNDWKKSDQDERFQPYRLWLRLSSKKWEVRAGLQKINFGSASMLRPLMWFDQMDPRDPLQLTNGVYGLLGRYYFKNNANLWLWGLYGNENPKGWEYFGSNKRKPELGGRFQFPFLKGELGASYNFRQAYTGNSLYDMGYQTSYNIPEHKIGLDGKWDVGIGLWVESSAVHTNSDEGLLSNRFYNNIGADYTIGIGNGLNVIYEQLFVTVADFEFDQNKTTVFSIFSGSYPIGLLDNISAIVYYSWRDGNWYRFVNFKRSYDNWSFYLMAFWNPDEFALYQMSVENNLFAGKGLQLMAVYNF